MLCMAVFSGSAALQVTLPAPASPLAPPPHPAQNYPAAYHSHDYDALLQRPAVAAAVAEHMAANAGASRPGTPTAADAEEAAAVAAAEGATEAAAAALEQNPEAAMELEAADPAAADPHAMLAGAEPPRTASPPPGSLPPSPRERPLSAAADDAYAEAAASASAAGESQLGADPTLGQVFASFLRPQLQQATQRVKAAAGAAAAAAHQQLSVAQAQLLQGAGSGEVGVGLLEAVAGGEPPVPQNACAARTCLGLWFLPCQLESLLEFLLLCNPHLFFPLAAGGRKRKAGKLQKALPWEQAAGSDSEGGIPACAATHALPPNGDARSVGGTAENVAAPAATDLAVGSVLPPPDDELPGYATPPAGGSPAPAQAELEALLAGVFAEGEDSSPGVLSPGGPSQQLRPASSWTGSGLCCTGEPAACARGFGCLAAAPACRVREGSCALGKNPSITRHLSGHVFVVPQRPAVRALAAPCPLQARWPPSWASRAPPPPATPPPSAAPATPTR
jgi:hypothetical protein